MPPEDLLTFKTAINKNKNEVLDLISKFDKIHLDYKKTHTKQNPQTVAISEFDDDDDFDEFGD